MSLNQQPEDIDHAEILTKVALFEDLRSTPQVFEKLFSFMRIKRFRAGEMIIREGEQGEDFFILADGSAAVFKKTQEGDLYKVAILHGHSGTFFGEGSLLGADTRTATIQAESDCVCLALAAEDFDRFGKIHPEAALPIFKRVAQVIMQRLKNMNRDLSLLYRALVDEFSRSA